MHVLGVGCGGIGGAAGGEDVSVSEEQAGDEAFHCGASAGKMVNQMKSKQNQAEISYVRHTLMPT